MKKPKKIVSSFVSSEAHGDAVPDESPASAAQEITKIPSGEQTSKIRLETEILVKRSKKQVEQAAEVTRSSADALKEQHGKR